MKSDINFFGAMTPHLAQIYFWDVRNILMLQKSSATDAGYVIL